MKEVILTAASILGTLGGWEMIKYLINRKTNTRKAEAEADSSEFTVLRDTVVFLQEQLQKKEERFAEQTDLVRKLTSENLELTRGFLFYNSCRTQIHVAKFLFFFGKFVKK